MNKAIYAGTFDPVTLGHLDVVERASRLFDQVLVTVATNSRKKPLFSVEERLDMLRESTATLTNVTCGRFDGLLIDFAVQQGASVLIRGLRGTGEFDYEQQMAHVNRRLNEQVVSIFMMPHEKYAYVNSSIVREVASYGGSVEALVTPEVAVRLREKFKKQ
ncbi:MAG: pantetheine-phosphate adenylyltransferase [Bacteroidetes bacterium]|nr:pantetheine-phosphate adenylyltransferase [Bacteroidota bacterium]